MTKMISIARVIFLALLGLTASVSFGQSGPGGVGTSATNKVWLDAHSMSFPDGSPVGSMLDLSGNGANFVQGASLRQPTYNATGISGIPSISFDGINDVLVSGAMAALNSANMTYFMVYDRTTLTSDMLINMNYLSGPTKYRTYMNSGAAFVLSAQYSPSINWVRYTDPAGASFMSAHYTPTNLQTYNQGTLMMTKTATNSVPTGHQNITLGNKSSIGTGTYVYTGEISEVIIYNTTLNPLQRIMVENYLGAKYAMTIPVDHYAFEGTHRFGLIGLGDDGTNTQTEAQGAGILELSDAAALGSGEFFLVAHTDFPTTEYNLVDLPVSLPDYQRLERTWRVDETGEVGTTTLTFHITGADDFAVPDSYRLLVDNDGVFTDATVVAGTYDAITSTVTFDVNLADGDYFTLAGILEIQFIHSITDGLWSEPTTWDCTCIPNASDHVFIDPATTVTVDIDAFVDFFRIEFNGTLVMDTDVTLDINGDWEILGITDFTAGEISLTGVVPQTVTIISTAAIVHELNDLTINNTSPGDVTFVDKTFILNGLLSPIRGNIVIDPTHTFIIASTSGTAGGRVGPIIPPTNFTGEFTVQRNIPSGLADWRDLSSPVIGSTFNTWDPDLAMSGPGFPDGCAFGPDGCFRSVTFMNHGIFNEVLNSSDPITNTRGYEIFVGSDLVSFIGTTLNSRGTLNTSADIVQVLNTGWTTIGNPYASPIAFSTLERTGSIGNYFYVYDPASGAYEWYDGASGTSSLAEITEDGLLATGQGIWVFASSVGSITYSQFNKVTNPATYIRSHETDNSLKLVLSETGSTYSGSARIEESEAALDGLDEIIDIRHLETGMEKAPGIAIITGAEKIRKNYVKADGRDKSFDLYTKFLNEGYYKISVENWANFRTYRKILLYDALTGETVNLKENAYSFYALTTDPEVLEKTRFTLILSNSEDAVEEGLTFTPTVDETDALVIKQFGHILDIQTVEEQNQLSTITVTNVLGQYQSFVVTTQLVNGSNLVTLPAELNGFYILSVQTGDQVITKKLML